MKRIGVKVVRKEEQQIKRELVLKERKVYMLKNKELRLEIIQLYHDVLVVEHRGKQKTMELVTRNYWQLEVTRDVERYIEDCNIYQRIKNKMEVPVEKLKLSEILERP